jgi:hypothetical protein
LPNTIHTVLIMGNLRDRVQFWHCRAVVHVLRDEATQSVEAVKAVEDSRPVRS